MKDLKDLVSQCYTKDTAQKKNWYSPAAAAYQEIRPDYPQSIISKTVELAQIPVGSNILEIGCGPGTATTSFAKLGFPMLCVEPNPDFYSLAQKNCSSYPQVQILNTSFEEWEPRSRQFDAVLAATSIHWIDPEVAYPKIAKVLRENGALILLWNVPAIASLEVHQVLQPIYEVHAPSLSKYKGKEAHAIDLEAIGQMAQTYGNFQNLVFEQIVVEVNYSIEEYLLLLSTFSGYIALDEDKRKSLFAALREQIQDKFGDAIQLSYLCAFHIAKKHDCSPA